MKTFSLPALLSAALTLTFLAACGGPETPSGGCRLATDCPSGFSCDAQSAQCVPSTFVPPTGPTPATGGGSGGSDSGSAGGIGGGSSGEGGGTSGPTGGGTGSTTSSSQVYPGAGVLRLNQSGAMDIAVGADGVTHVAMAGRNGVSYGRCEKNCDTASSWAFVNLGAKGEDGSARIRLSASGDVHIAWVDGGSFLEISDSAVMYATCSGTCSSSSSWKVLQVSPRTYVDYRGSYFALIGRTYPNAVYQLNGQTYLAECDVSDCSVPTHWSSSVLATFEADVPSIAGTFSDLFFSYNDVNANAAHLSVFHYASSTWSPDVQVLPSKWARLALDGSGRAWMVTTSGVGGSTLTTTNCAGACTAASSWTAATVTTSADTEYSGAEISFDAQNRPLVVATHLDVQLYACSANCTTAAPSYAFSKLVEVWKDPVPASPCANAFWESEYPAAAYHPSGKVLVGFRPDIFAWGGSCTTSFSTESDARLTWK